MSYPSAEMQLVYSTAPADKTTIIIAVRVYIYKYVCVFVCKFIAKLRALSTYKVFFPLLVLKFPNESVAMTT